MIQTLTNKDFFTLVYNSDKNLLTYIFNDGAVCSLWPNSSDKKHGEILGLSALQHKLIHEITHHYVSKALGFNFCPIVYAEAHKTPFPENAEYLEEIIFSLVYFCMEKPMLYNNWYSYLDRLYNTDIYELKDIILEKCLMIGNGRQAVTL